MLKNLEIWVTEKCNSRCLMCHWWKNERVGADKEISPQQMGRLLSKKDFNQVESAQISGGEPTMRGDIFELIKSVINNLPKLKKLTITSNGIKSRVALRLLRKIRRASDINLTLCVSLEGNRVVHKTIRGIDCYNSALKTLELCRKNISGLKTIVLTTVTPLNCRPELLEHVRNIATSTNSAFSFRAAYNSNAHHRSDDDKLVLSEKQREILTNFIYRYYSDDPFLSAQVKYLKTGEMLMMSGCLAGKLFVNIRSSGDIYPCINSTRKIGDSKRGIYENKIIDLRKYEICPCCDEACFYPMYHEKIRSNK